MTLGELFVGTRSFISIIKALINQLILTIMRRRCRLLLAQGLRWRQNNAEFWLALMEKIVGQPIRVRRSGHHRNPCAESRRTYAPPYRYIMPLDSTKKRKKMRGQNVRHTHFQFISVINADKWRHPDLRLHFLAWRKPPTHGRRRREHKAETLDKLSGLPRVRNCAMYDDILFGGYSLWNGRPRVIFLP